MINGMHAIVYAPDAEATRDFFKDVLGFANVDASGGWRIFALPPAELGIHPTDEQPSHEMYLMCDDMEATVADLEAKGVEFTQGVEDEGWGLVTRMAIPGGGELAMYEPRHPTAIERSAGG